MPLWVLPKAEGFYFLEFTVNELQNHLADIMQPPLYRHIPPFNPKSFVTVRIIIRIIWVKVYCTVIRGSWVPCTMGVRMKFVACTIASTPEEPDAGILHILDCAGVPGIGITYGG